MPPKNYDDVMKAIIFGEPFNSKQVLVGDLTTGYSFEDPAKLEAEKLRVEKENNMKEHKNTTAKELVNSVYGRMNYNARMNYNGRMHYNGMYQPKRSLSDFISKVVFNDPATIVFWKDGTKTVVKAEGEPFDPEKGMAMACAKKLGFNNGTYYDAFKEWLPIKGEPLEEKKPQLLSTKQLAEKIGCSPRKIAKECREGQCMGAKKINGVWWIPFYDQD